MTDHSGLDARLSRFLVDQAPRRVPERLIDATRDVIAGTRQRRRFRDSAGSMRARPSGVLSPPAA